MSILKMQPKVGSLIQKAFRNQKLVHAYLFSGEAGVGKKDMAFWMAKRFFCLEQSNNEPCHQCGNCKRIDSMNHPDLHFVEPDGQSIKIDQIRMLQKEFQYKGVESEKKCYIIQDVDKMTVQAANSLLKFLEEPNGHSLAILLTENRHRMLDTILSRVQVYQFQPLNEKDLLTSYLDLGLDEDSAFLLSKSTTSFSLGQTYLEDNWFQQAKSLLFQTMDEFIQNPYGATVTIQTEWPALFSDKEKQQISIKLLTIWFQQIVNATLNREVGIKNEHALLKDYKERIGVVQATEILDELIYSKGKLRSNTHYILVLEQICKVLIDCFNPEELEIR
ncbi:DNA polymerase III subunit delta' [Bacillus sp. FJAT-29937]|uniref:DNA polymerase III subunit delta' n=1 Tax=Bacillus sp. FJAT-29937 TaxID=1720553 RepID=UPI00082A31B3|nr:DNA polymerase III subunit delta' [Bacillus sp. FJAT-29937]